MVDSLPPRSSRRAVRAIVSARAANFKYAFYGLPADQRAAMEAIYAFARRADDAVDDAGTREEKAARLAAVSGGLEKTRRGAPPDPAFEALGWAMARFSIPTRPLELILDGCAEDLGHDGYGTFESVYGYCYKVASAVGLACLPVWGVSAPEALRPAEALGIGMQWVNIIRDCREDALAGRCYFPGEELARAGLTPADFRGPPADAAKREALRKFLAGQVERAREFLTAGAELLPMVPAGSRRCPTLLRGFYARLLERIAPDPLAVLDGKLSLGFFEKWALFIESRRG
jgi:phytoene synthase